MAVTAENKEIEVRFVEVDFPKLKEILIALGAIDAGEDFLEEIIFYDKDLAWRDGHKFVRARTNRKGTVLSFKHHNDLEGAGAEEIEIEVDDLARASLFLERVGLIRYREQQKRRHTFILDGVTIDFDSWPKIPTYVELEGKNLESIKSVAAKMRLDWEKVIFENAGWIIKHLYGIPVQHLRYFTFEKQE